jgi:hypothetical protein
VFLSHTKSAPANYFSLTTNQHPSSNSTGIKEIEQVGRRQLMSREKKKKQTGTQLKNVHYAAPPLLQRSPANQLGWLPPPLSALTA